MSKLKIIIALSAWAIILPYLGFPYSLKETLFSITGLAIILLASTYYRDQKKRGEEEKKVFENFSENNKTYTESENSDTSNF